MWQRLKERYRTRRAFRWAVEGFALLALVAALGAWQTRRHLSGVPVPAFTLRTLEGGTVSSASLAGQRTLVVLWAPWCGVCKAQSDNVDRVLRWTEGRAHVVSIALAYEDTPSVLAAAQGQQMKTPVLLGNQALETAFQVEAYPTLYFLDEAGQVKHSATGYTTTVGMLWRLLL